MSLSPKPLQPHQPGHPSGRVEPRRRALCAGVATLLCAAAAQPTLSWGQAAPAVWPARPIRLIVPFPPGGSADVAARLISQEAARLLGQAFVVENRAGAAGNLGAESVARAAPDGYTALYGIGSVVTTNPWLYTDMRFDPLRDLLPVTLTNAGGGFVLVAPSASPWASLQDWIRETRARPGRLNYASYGSGSAVHLVMEMLKDRAGLFLTHIPYRGAAPAMNALLAGQVDVMFDTLINTQPHIRSGRLRPLAVTTARRMSQLPGVPSVAETYSGFQAEGWHGVFLPAGTPREIAVRLDEVIRRALKAAPVERWMEENGLKAGQLGLEAFAEMVRADHARWGAVVRARQVVPD